jgi:hypothetical protein
MADVIMSWVTLCWEKRVVCVHLALRLSLDRVDRVGPVVVRQRGWLGGLFLVEASGGPWRSVSPSIGVKASSWNLGGPFCRSPRAVIRSSSVLRDVWSRR